MNLVHTYTLNKAMKKWGEIATAVAIKEMKQLRDRLCSAPIDAKELDPVEIEQALELFMFLAKSLARLKPGQLGTEASRGVGWAEKKTQAQP